MAKDSGSGIKGTEGYWFIGRLRRSACRWVRVRGSMGRFGLGGEEMEVYGQRVCVALREEGKRWREEVAERSNLGKYMNRQAALGRAEYVKGFGRGDEI